MPSKIERIDIVTKMGDRAAGELGSEIAAWLGARGVSAQVWEHRQDSVGSAVQDPGRPDMVLVLGGDGTLLSVARKYMPTGIPLLGINVGHLGFLAKADVGDWPLRLEKLLEKGLDVEERLALNWQVLREGRVVHQNTAINDVVVSRGPMARLIRLRLFCEGELVAALRADGVIVSSPTGSTAYSISAGGAILHPALDAMGVTSICAFMGNLRSMVIPASVAMDILVEEVWGEVFLTEDGQQGQRLVAGDLVRVTKAKQGLRLVHLDGAGFFATLQDKGFTR